MECGFGKRENFWTVYGIWQLLWKWDSPNSWHEMRYIGRIAPDPPASWDLRGPFASPPPPVESTLPHPCLQLIGTSRSEDAMAEKRCIKSEFAFFRSSSRLFSLTYFVKMKANPPGVEFLRTVSKFRKRNKIRRAKTAKKCTKMLDARAKLSFCLWNLFFWHSRCRRLVGS